MTNNLPFNEFLTSLCTTNRTLDFFVDWDKCLANRDSISISLNHLNFLLGKGKQEIEKSIFLLFEQYSKAFQVLPILLAIKDFNQFVLDPNNNDCSIETYLTSPDKIYEFILQSGLDKIFSDRKIKDLNDFVFGIEVGLDTNARKNRSGKIMEVNIRRIFTNSNLNFKEQVSIQDFKDLYSLFGKDIKKFDFVIYANNKTYFIETNFYSSQGSKLNEIARSYQEIALKFKPFKEYDFIWITDGKGWLSSKNKLQEAYESVEIYNLSNICEFIKKVKNDK